MRDDDVTRKLETPKPNSSRASSFESIYDARFVSGTILADRYRIVGLLGKGGMGLLATMAHQLFFFLAIMYPMTTDFSAWYAPSMVFALALAVGIAVYGCYISLGGQSPFGNRLLHDD